MKLIIHQRHARAFTLTDLVSVIVIFVITSNLVGSGIQALRGEVDSSRFQSDIRALNNAVYLFRASGGDLSDALTPDQVIAKMRATEDDRLTLTINSILVDGLRPIYQSSREAETEASRAFWDVENQLFVVKRGGEKGIKEFREDPDL